MLCKGKCGEQNPYLCQPSSGGARLSSPCGHCLAPEASGSGGRAAGSQALSLQVLQCSWTVRVQQGWGVPGLRVPLDP